MAKPSLGSTNTSHNVVFNVTRRAPELIAPAGPTPYEFKELSDIDDQYSLRFQFPVIQFYRNVDKHSGRDDDPARVIKEAVAKALVAYYPFAGRLREKQGRKLVVECNREGIMFIEADADVSLNDFGDALHPPFPHLEELLYDVPGSTHILNTPLILIQVTRLICGGFILALRHNHTMADGHGLVQFMHAIAELARGAESLSIQPVWERHLLRARDPPRVTCEHREYEKVADPKGTIIPVDDIVYKNFFFGSTEIAALKRLIPTRLKSTRISTFELISSCIWRCRTIALQPEPEEVVRLMFLVNARTVFNPPLPKGYYGNVFAFSGVFSTAKKLSSSPLDFALELVRDAKVKITQEYMMSLLDHMVLEGRPHHTVAWNFLISNVSQIGFADLDFGWGAAIYGGPAEAGLRKIPNIVSHYTPIKNNEGKKGIVVPMRLPHNAMEIFIKELNGLLSDNVHDRPIIATSRSSSIISSSL